MIQTTPSLGFSDAINASTSRIFQFKGRSRRSEFWWTQLLVFIVSCVLTPFVGSILELLTIPLMFRRLHDTGHSGWWWGACALLKFVFIVYICFDIANVIIHEGDCITHGNDIEFMIFFLFKYIVFAIAIAICQIVLLIFCCLDSDQNTNKYGASPKYVELANNI